MESSSQQSKIDVNRAKLRNSELFVAIGKGKLHKVKALLESGVKTDITDKNDNDKTPLHSAVENDKKEIVAELLNPKWKTNLNLKDAENRTPLDIAQQKNYKEIIELLENHDESRNNKIVLESTQGQNETGNQKNNLLALFEKTEGSAAIGGQQCEINLSMLLLLKGKLEKRFTQFYLASNFKKADKFDDVVFSYTNEKGKLKALFVQSKHKTQGVKLKDLLSKKETGDFALNKYFISYRKIKQNFLSNETPKDPVFCGNFDDSDFIIYTTAQFECGNNNCVKKIAIEENDLFRMKDSRGKCYQLVFDSEKKQRIFDILKNSSDCRRLAKELASAFFSQTALDLRKDIIKTYHTVLLKQVIHKVAKKKGKLRQDFFSNKENQFRTIFFEEAGKVYNQSVDKLVPQLQEMELKLPKKFWDQNASGSPDLPNDDPIEEHEVESFLSKFKLYAGQPNENLLESVIKKTAGGFYKIDQQDIDQVFAIVENKVKNWWKGENNYLTKDNKFFEDAVRVSVEFDVIEPVASFTGRTQVLMDLHKVLQEGGAVSISQIATITGLGGIGKSETARKYLREYKEHYDNNIIWINAENHLTITQSFQKLAKDKLKISITDENNKEKDNKVLAEDVYNYFKKMNRKSIFVFDNAEKQRPGDNYVDEWLPPGLNKPYVIITTRDQDWDGIEKLPLGLFTREEAEAFVKNALKGIIKIEYNELRKLTKELDCLPLALRQAVAYISAENERLKIWSNKQFSISCYLDEFQKNANPLLSSGRIRNHTGIVMTTWKTTIKKIRVANNLAVAILQVIAYLAPDQIPVEEIFGKENEEEIRCATELLEQYSMISIKGGKVNIHRLVQKVTRIEMEETEQNEQALANTFMLLKACYPYGRDKIDDLFKKRMMLPHIEVFSSHIETLIQKKPEEWARIEKEILLGLFNWMVDGYEYNPRRRKELQERALTITEAYYGPDHFQTAVTVQNLGNAYGVLGDAEKQKKLLERALPVIEKYYGPDHVQVAVIFTNLGNAYGNLGDNRHKKELLERALRIHEAYYGPDHYQVALTLANLGNAYGALGDAEKQKKLLERALPVIEKYYGPDHVQVAVIFTNLGNAYGNLGDNRHKKELLERALRIHEAYYGPDHYQVALTLANLGNAYGDLGDPQKKKELLERALTINETYYGPDHFQVAFILTNLGNAYRDLCDVPKSKQLLERALTINENYYGPDHFKVGVTLTNLGGVYFSLGDARKQIELLERALTINEGYYGPDHFQVGTTLTNLSSAYYALGDTQKIKQLLERALTIKEKHYGPDHFQVGKVLTNLGGAYCTLGDAQKSKLLLERALVINETYYGPDHFQVGITLTNLGEAYFSLGDAQKTKQLLERALTINEGYYGPDHFQVGKVLTNLSNAYYALGDAQKEIQLLERALPIFENYYGPNHFQVGLTLFNLGNTYGALGNAEKQKHLLERALPIFKDNQQPINFQMVMRK